MIGAARRFLSLLLGRMPPERREQLADVPERDRETIRAVRPYTMTSPERIAALCEATRYVVRAGVPGAIVECGVWRGGSMMAVARTLLAIGAAERELYLFDTFEGMTMPSEKDVSLHGESAADLVGAHTKSEEDPFWCYAPLDAVKRAILSTGYPEERVHFVKGRVEDSLPANAPAQVALLRLDTDWYESTLHELVHLYPLLSERGALIIDDYGHWEGARRAVDEYIATNRLPLLLTRVDYTGRVTVKS